MARFKIGDRVVTVGVGRRAPEWDIGTVQAVTPHWVFVYWERAKEGYREDPASLMLAP